MDGYDNTRPPIPQPTLFEATFINSASSPSDVLFVMIDAFGEQPFGDPDGVVWSPMGGALPQAGDRALVGESDDGSWWVIAWWSAAQTVYPAASVSVASFSNGWVNFDGTRVATYYEDRGRVYLAGVIKSGAIGSAAFTLPAGFRPPTQIDTAVTSNGAFGNVAVLPTGDVVPTIGSNVYVILDPIDFRIA